MAEADELYHREELLGAFETVHREASELFRSFSGDDFFRHPADGVWSPAENVIHLIKSVQAVASAMGIPKLALAVLPTINHARQKIGPLYPSPFVLDIASRIDERVLARLDNASRVIVLAFPDR